MVFVQFEYSYRKRNILIEGTVDGNTLQFIQLLKKVCDRFYFDKIIDKFAGILNYQNQELGSFLLTLLSILLTQVPSQFFFNTNQMNGYSHIILVATIVFIFLVQIVIPKTKLLFVQAAMDLIFAVGFIVVLALQFNDLNILLCFLVVNTTLLTVNALKYFIQEGLKDKVSAIFQFQSNILIFFYLAGKAIQFGLPYIFDNTSIDSFNLIPTIICLMLINSLKIWNLFDFNTIFLIKTLSEVHKQDMLALENKQYVENILNLAFLINNVSPAKTTREQSMKDNKSQPSDMYNLKQLDYSQTNYQQDPTNYQQDPNEQNRNKGNESNGSNGWKDNNFQKRLESTYMDTLNDDRMKPYSNAIVIAFAINMAISLAFVLFILLEVFTHQQLYVMMFMLIKMCVLMLYCEFQSILLSQIQKHQFYQLTSLLSDMLMISPIFLLIVYFTLLPSQSYQSIASIIMLSLIPITTITVYKYYTQKLTQSQDNKTMLVFYVVWVVVFGMRQAFIIGLGSYQQYFYIIDGFILTYLLAIVLLLSKFDMYHFIYLEIKKLFKMKKYKLYIIQSLKKYTQQSASISRLMFFLNLLIIFLGWVQYNLIESCSQYYVQYLMVLFSCLFIHILQCYYEYYTQQWIINQKQPGHSPYILYIILFLPPITYTLYAYLFQVDGSSLYDDHKRWSLILIMLVTFIVIINVINMFIFQAMIHYQASCKLITAITSYCIYYYPFITGFTVYFYAFNLNTALIFQFALAAFAYIAITSTIAGTIVHLILNLTEKSKRTLYVVNYLSQQLKKIKLKQDLQVFSMIQNLYDLMDGNTSKLLKQLQKQKVYKVIIQDQIDDSFDYIFGQPERHKVKDQFIKILAQHNQANKRISTRKSIKFLTLVNDVREKILKNQLPSLNELVKKQPQLGFNRQDPNIFQTPSNINLIQIKRLLQIKQDFIKSQQQREKTFQKINLSKDFVSILNNCSKTRELMHRFYSFLAHPSQQINQDTIKLIDELFPTRINESLSSALRFTQNGYSLTQQNFHDFLLEYMMQKYSLSTQELDTHQIYKQFCINYVFVFITKGNDVFKYYMKRKNVEYSREFDQIWKKKKNINNIINQSQFRYNYAVKKQRAMRKNKNKMDAVIEKDQNQLKALQQSDDQKPNELDKNLAVKFPIQDIEVQKKKHKLFLSPDTIYTIIVNHLIDCLNNYQKIQHQNFKISSIKLTLSNLIAILTKLFDFSYLYTYGSVMTLYGYAISDFSNNKIIIWFIDYKFVLAFAMFCVLLYYSLIFFHKNDFQTGKLGLDKHQRTLSFTNIKFYSIFLLFLLGSSFSSIIIMASLNSYMCSSSSLTLFNFPSQTCYIESHLVEMYISLLILLSYYPLSLLIFPFSTAIDRTLQIKYKSEYEILYLQCKLFLNGINVIFNAMDFQQEQLIKSIAKTIICIILAIFFNRLQPCSVTFINALQGKIYFGLIIINSASILCYIIGLKYTLIVFGVLFFLYILYSLLSAIKVLENLFVKETKDFSNELIKEKLHKQQIHKLRLKQKEQSPNSYEPQSFDNSQYNMELNDKQKMTLQNNSSAVAMTKFFNFFSKQISPKVPVKIVKEEIVRQKTSKQFTITVRKKQNMNIQSIHSNNQSQNQKVLSGKSRIKIKAGLPKK